MTGQESGVTGGKRHDTGSFAGELHDDAREQRSARRPTANARRIT